MSSRVIRTAVLSFVSALALLTVQTASGQESTSNTPVAPQPKVKSQKEVDAIMAIQNALDPDSRIKAVEELIRNFSDTEFKAFALQMAAFSAQQKNDFEQMMIYGERTLEADPKNYAVLVMMAPALAQRTREFDLDKEEKLSRAEKYANEALKAIDAAPRPNPNVTDQQWDEAKNDFRGQAYEGLGLVSMARKDFEKAVAQFKQANDLSPNAPAKIRMAAALNAAGKHDEAIAAVDEVMADPQLNPQLKNFAQAEKVRAVQAKEAKSKQ
ncbi:MAG: tetratricopeptide repeat protein [Bryobacteraceae bacterium]|nr:tetratricopeptide repeat protein [Bryobacteraceae bacterium]